MKNLPRTFLILGVVLVLIGIGIIYSSYRTAQAPTDGAMTATTTPATTTAPVATTSSGLQTYSDNSVTFRYPAELPTSYIHASEWPPKITASTASAVCGMTKNKTGETKHSTINGRDYCVTVSSEGAAGSTYTTYTYKTLTGGKIVTLTFVLRMVQCLNYDDPQQTACIQERTSFSVDNLADSMMQTVVLK